MTRYLVTGGAGFIGSHLAEWLLEGGHEVVIIDDLSTGAIANVAHLKANPRFRYVLDTVMNRPVMAELIDDVDAIFHLAAAVGVRLIVESPVRTIESNVAATELVLALAARKGKPTFIASTSEVYGTSTDIPFRESGSMVLGAPNKGRWAYACSKAIDEFMALAYYREKGLPTVVGRLFNTIGPRQSGRYGMVVPTLVRQALDGRPLTIYGDGQQTRCFADVRDVVAAIGTLMATDMRVYGQVFNIGSDNEVTIAQLAGYVLEQANLVGQRGLKMIPYEQAYADGFEDMPRRVPSLDKIEHAIGWRARYPLFRTLRDVIDYERSRR